MSKIIITPLGTISPYTKGNMNCPGFLVEYNSKKILLDCGNGITRLLNFPNDLKDLNVIITHYHKDHFGDLDITFEDNNSHTIESYMVKLQNKDFKIIYTSDIGTTNLGNLVNFCKDADLIICESSFLQKHNANSKTHMTAYDTGILASKSNVQKLLLTHFWPEEDKRLYLEEAKQNFENVEVAEEGKKLILKR